MYITLYSTTSYPISQCYRGITSKFKNKAVTKHCMIGMEQVAPNSTEQNNHNRQCTSKGLMQYINPLQPHKKVPTNNDKKELARIIEDTGGDYLHEEQKNHYGKKQNYYTERKSDEVHLPQIVNMQKQSTGKLNWNKESIMVSFGLLE